MMTTKTAKSASELRAKNHSIGDPPSPYHNTPPRHPSSMSNFILSTPPTLPGSRGGVPDDDSTAAGSTPSGVFKNSPNHANQQQQQHTYHHTSFAPFSLDPMSSFAHQAQILLNGIGTSAPSASASLLVMPGIVRKGDGGEGEEDDEDQVPPSEQVATQYFVDAVVSNQNDNTTISLAEDTIETVAPMLMIVEEDDDDGEGHADHHQSDRYSQSQKGDGISRTASFPLSLGGESDAAGSGVSGGGASASSADDASSVISSLQFFLPNLEAKSHDQMTNTTGTTTSLPAGSGASNNGDKSGARKSKKTRKKDRNTSPSALDLLEQQQKNEESEDDGGEEGRARRLEQNVADLETIYEYLQVARQEAADSMSHRQAVWLHLVRRMRLERESWPRDARETHSQLSDRDVLADVLKRQMAIQGELVELHQDTDRLRMSADQMREYQNATKQSIRSTLGPWKKRKAATAVDGTPPSSPEKVDDELEDGANAKTKSKAKKKKKTNSGKGAAADDSAANTAFQLDESVVEELKSRIERAQDERDQLEEDLLLMHTWFFLLAQRMKQERDAWVHAHTKRLADRAVLTKLLTLQIELVKQRTERDQWRREAQQLKDHMKSKMLGSEGADDDGGDSNKKKTSITSTTATSENGDLLMMTTPAGSTSATMKILGIADDSRQQQRGRLKQQNRGMNSSAHLDGERRRRKKPPRSKAVRQLIRLFACCQINPKDPDTSSSHLHENGEKEEEEDYARLP